MKNLFCIIILGLIAISTYSQQSNNIGLLSSLSNTEVNSLNSKILAFKVIKVSSNLEHNYSKKHATKRKFHLKTKGIANKDIDTLQNNNSPLNTSETKVNYNDSINSISNKCCVIKYFAIKNGNYKYGVHVEGHVQDCIEKVAIPHAYVSLNSAVVAGKYLIIPTTEEGKFNIDVIDDSIGSITVIKKGYSDKEVKLQEATLINDNTSYAFNVCLEKERLDTNTIINNNQVTQSPNLLAFFGFNKFTLNKSTRTLLDSLIKSIKKSNNHPTSIDLNGYTDSKGHKKYNLELSKERAIECRKYLINHGLAHVKIRVHAYGSSNPIEKEIQDNNLDNPKARAQNRRVEIVLHSK